MSELSRTAMVLGTVLGMLNVPLLVAPEAALDWIRNFPRSRWAAWVLTATDLIWVGYILHVRPLPWFDPLREWLILMVPAAFFLVVVFMHELLAPRALGGLLLLVPMPILEAAFMHPSPLRLVVVVTAYLAAIKGIILVLSPYQFRKTAAWCLRNPFACRVWGSLGLCLGAFIVALAIWAY